MVKIFLALPPIISIFHVLISLALYYLGIQFQGNIFLFIGLPIVLVLVIHVIIVFIDKSMGVTERIGYALIHIPFSLVFSVSSLLILTLNNADDTKAKSTLTQCEDKSKVQCINSLYQRSDDS
jgi:hypothetical protein